MDNILVDEDKNESTFLSFSHKGEIVTYYPEHDEVKSSYEWDYADIKRRGDLFFEAQNDYFEKIREI